MNTNILGSYALSIIIGCILISFSDKVNEQTFPPMSCVYTETHDQQLCMIYYTKVFFLFSLFMKQFHTTGFLSSLKLSCLSLYYA